MNKEQLVQLIEAYADAKSTSNSYLIGLVAQELSKTISILFPEPEDIISKEITPRPNRTKS